MSATLEVRATLAAEQGLRDLQAKFAAHSVVLASYRATLAANRGGLTAAEVAMCHRMVKLESIIVELANGALANVPSDLSARLYFLTGALLAIAELEEGIES